MHASVLTLRTREKEASGANHGSRPVQSARWVLSKSVQQSVENPSVKKNDVGSQGGMAYFLRFEPPVVPLADVKIFQVSREKQRPR